MSEIIQKTDYSTNLALLMEQYKNSTNLKALIDTMNDQADDLETALFEIRDLIYLETAEGVQLNMIGAVFGVARNGASDSDYRALIKFRASLIASGEPEAIIALLQRFYGATFVRYFPPPILIPAAFYLLTDAIITLEELTAFSPAGVQPYILTGAEFEDGTPIEFEDGNIMYFA